MKAGVFIFWGEGAGLLGYSHRVLARLHLSCLLFAAAALACFSAVA